jgi:hypothetical protein
VKGVQLRIQPPQSYLDQSYVLLRGNEDGYIRYNGHF